MLIWTLYREFAGGQQGFDAHGTSVATYGERYSVGNLFFCRDKNWIAYERVQADVFDHILAVIPVFGLQVFQEPSGKDLKELKR